MEEWFGIVHIELEEWFGVLELISDWPLFQSIAFLELFLTLLL